MNSPNLSQVAALMGSVRSRRKTKAARINGKLGGRPAKKVWVIIYGIKLDGHVHYVGSSVDYQKRIRAHRNSGTSQVKALLLRGAVFVILRRCHRNAFEQEAGEIKRLQALGQCELNRSTPTEKLRTGPGDKFWVPELQQSFPTRAAAVRALGIPVGESRNHGTKHRVRRLRRWKAKTP